MQVIVKRIEEASAAKTTPASYRQGATHNLLPEFRAQAQWLSRPGHADWLSLSQGGLYEKIATETGLEPSDWSRDLWAYPAKEPEYGPRGGAGPAELFELEAK